MQRHNKVDGKAVQSVFKIGYMRKACGDSIRRRNACEETANAAV